MRTTVVLDDDLIARAQELTGITEKSAAASRSEGIARRPRGNAPGAFTGIARTVNAVERHHFRYGRPSLRNSASRFAAAGALCPERCCPPAAIPRRDDTRSDGRRPMAAVPASPSGSARSRRGSAYGTGSQAADSSGSAHRRRPLRDAGHGAGPGAGSPPAARACRDAADRRTARPCRRSRRSARDTSPRRGRAMCFTTARSCAMNR